MAAATTTPTVETPTPDGVLAAVRADQAGLSQLEISKMLHAIDWAIAHEVMRLDDAMFLAGYGEHGLTLAGPGAPLVGESAVAELSLALGVSTESGGTYLGECLEIRYRLPQLWEQVLSASCPVWRARKIAQATMNLCEEGAAFVDSQVSAFARSVSWAQLDRLVEEALVRWEPEVAEEKRKAAAERRHVTIEVDEQRETGTATVDGCLDLADARDLDAALSARARELRELGSAESMDVRRSLALGDLARSQDTLAFGADPTTGVVEERAPASVSKPRPSAGRTVNLHVHVSDAAITGIGYDPAQHALARLGTGKGWVLTEQVREWCRTAARITITPVLDLAEAIHVESYETSQRQRDQAQERDRTCVFPFCTKNATRCDIDHRVAHAVGGCTCSENLAPLCRSHHRAKTHQGWSYDSPTPGIYVWRTPYGLRYLRCFAGTIPLDDPPPPSPRPVADAEPEPVAETISEPEDSPGPPVDPELDLDLPPGTTDPPDE